MRVPFRSIKFRPMGTAIARWWIQFLSSLSSVICSAGKLAGFMINLRMLISILSIMVGERGIYSSVVSLDTDLGI